jgi:hypothetical protein
LFSYPKFVSRVCGKSVVCHQLHGNCPGEFCVETSLHVNISKFLFFGCALRSQLPPLGSQVSLFRVGLRTYRYVFTGCHRESTGHKTRDACQNYLVAGRTCGGNPNYKTRCGQNTVIRA